MTAEDERVELASLANMARLVTYLEQKLENKNGRVLPGQEGGQLHYVGLGSLTEVRASNEPETGLEILFQFSADAVIYSVRNSKITLLSTKTDCVSVTIGGFSLNTIMEDVRRHLSW
jgi:hypothetical protein